MRNVDILEGNPHEQGDLLMPKADGTLTNEEKATFWAGIAAQVGPLIVSGLKDLVEAASSKGKSLKPPKKPKSK